MSLGRGCAPGRLFFPRAADAPARSALLPAFHGRRSGLLPRPRLHIRLRPGALHGTVRDAAGLPLQGLLHTPAHLLLELLRRLTGRPLQSQLTTMPGAMRFSGKLRHPFQQKPGDTDLCDEPLRLPDADGKRGLPFRVLKEKSLRISVKPLAEPQDLQPGEVGPDQTDGAGGGVWPFPARL